MIATGTINLKGCFCTRRTYNILHKFAVGSVVYRADKARRGILEKITIKRAEARSSRSTYGQTVIMYIDTYNALYSEDDLVSHADAIDMATAYYTTLMANIDQELEKLSC